MYLSNPNPIRVKKIQILPADIITLDSVPVELIDTTNIKNFVPLQITLVSPLTTRIDDIDSLSIETGDGRIISLVNPNISQLSYNTNYFFSINIDPTLYGSQMSNAYDYLYLKATTSATITNNGTEGIYIYINYLQYKI